MKWVLVIVIRVTLDLLGTLVKWHIRRYNQAPGDLYAPSADVIDFNTAKQRILEKRKAV